MKQVFFLFTILFFSFSFGQESSSIQGNILDGELFNEPLLMASVSIENTSLSTHTNFHGKFEFDNLTPGAYNIIVQFLGYETIKLPVTITSGETTNVQASLQAKTLSLIGASTIKTTSK
tara:strand:+ start:992 stop:1348 length:357 start_codon:yes stop_codon:yes gene_type:complete